MSDSFTKARTQNAIYGDTYGERKRPDHPEWYGIAGDRAAVVRASFPTIQTKKYFRSDRYNVNRNNFYATGNLGNKPFKVNNQIVLTANPNIHPVPEAYSEVTYDGDSSGLSNSDYWMAGLAISGFIIFFIVASKMA